ncbi:kinesin-like protein KIN-12E [Vigna umbellata]|uniref:kinesin-like protein KIN-12E n=1 Tax=Vigna umbellata TaxID=87088 RepID=UPI001F5EA6BB|nr:kinesin-like protein KIN-12E [Vigna umbellata]
MPFLSEAASAIKSRFGFHDHPSASLSLVQNTPDLLKSATKDSLAQSSIVRNLSDWDDESVVGQSSAAVSSSRSFEFCEDPSFWKDHNVQVIIRMRPLSNSEISVQGYGKCVRQESCQTITWTGHPESRFTFDAVADENVSQENLFKVAGLPMVENCMGGYNSCMFAYGQTGSGKTHTMLGDIEGGTRRHSVNSGMTPRIFEHLFSRIQKEKEARRDEKLKFTCKCSFLEIYNEQILDLLEPSSNNLQIREDSKKGVYVENLKEIEVNYAREVIQLLIQGASNRKVAATNMNRASSRSHSVFTCIIESQWESQGVTHFRYARLNLVDLAGSERQKSSGAEGERLKEATNINKSLSTLGLVIMNLVSISNGKSLHVPYRDSKLTFLLQDSLGGNSKTIIIANISPSICCSLETLSTLKFAQRAKYIKNNAIVNEDASGDVIAMRIQIQQLKKELSRLRGLVAGGEIQDNDNSVISFPGSPGCFKWEGVQGSFSPLTSVKRISQKKDYDIALVGAFRREKDKEMKLQALRDEVQASMKLVKQREDEIQSLKMRLRFREAGIKRLEAVASEKISAETHLLKEKEEHLKEIEVLRAQVDRNNEVTRFAMENLQLKEEIRRLKSFCLEGEREQMSEQIMALENKLLEALDWKFMHEPDLKANSDPMMEDVRSDDNLVSKLESSPKLRWQSSLREENEFLRIQAIQNQAEMDTIFKKLEVCLEEKEKLKSHVDDLTAKLEHEKSRTVNEGKQQMDLPSTIDMPVINNNDQLELKAMVDAIAAASQREAEAHETAIILAKENDELKMKLKTLIEDNSKLIELYEQAAAENINRNAHKGEDAHETGSQIDNGCFSLEITKEEAELKGVVENLQHQLMEINEENEKLMNLYERAMQERDDLKRTLSCIGQDQVETKGFVDCPEKLVEVDGGERDLRVEIISQEVRGESENKYEPTTTSGSDMDVDCDAYEQEKLLKDDSEADVLVNSEKYNLSEAKLSEELSCATKKLERVDEHISDAVKTIASLGCAETATVQVDELSREIEITEHDIHIKRQQFESLKLKLSEAHERRTIVDKKLSALKYSLSNFPSTFSYFVQRETRARAVVKDLTSHLDHKKGKLADLQASKQGLENAKEKNQESEVELKKNIACIKLKLEEENRKHEDEKVLIAVENTQNIDSSLKNWHLRSKATDLLKFEEEKTTLQAEMKLSQQKLGVIRKELENLNKKGANVESQIEAVQLEIKQCLRNTEEKELALERVMKEKEMLLEFRDNCMTEIEHMIIELQQHVFEYDLKEGEMKILGEELQMDLTRAEELQTARVIAANNKNSFSSISYSGMLEKLEDEMQNLHTSVQETRLLLEGISRAA